MTWKTHLNEKTRELILLKPVFHAGEKEMYTAEWLQRLGLTDASVEFIDGSVPVDSLWSTLICWCS